MLTYKGYTAKVEYDPGDHILCGFVLDTNDEILFEATDVEQIEQEFHLAIDDYLEMCLEIGKTPDKPFSVSVHLRISPDLHRDISIAAQLANKSMNSYIIEKLQHRC